MVDANPTDRDTAPSVYLALGDSMSIDDYTGVEGGGAASQLARRLGPGWTLDDRTADGCVMPLVPRDAHGDLITLTIGGNDLLMMLPFLPEAGLDSFESAHRELLQAIRRENPDAQFIVGNIYAPGGDFGAELGDELRALLDEANEIIARNTDAVDARLADIHGAFAGNEDTYLCLEIEPTLDGATAIADLFEAAVTAGGAHAPR